MPPTERAGPLRLAAAAALTGVGAGVFAALLSLLLHAAERLLFGAATAGTTEAAVLAPPVDRAVTLAVAGTAAAGLWWLLRRRPIPTPEQAAGGAAMPPVRTILNAALQVVHVAAGASVGREGAPRELGALAAARLAPVFGLSDRQRRVLVACGAGAGLGAVYDVPVAGVLFALETMLVLRSARDAILPASICTAVATTTGWLLGVTPAPLYVLRTLPWGVSLVVLALLLGPALGLAGAGFGTLVDRLARSRRVPAAVLVLLPAASVLVALLALPLRRVVGNGQAAVDLAFEAGAPVVVLLALAVAKALATAVTLGAGSAGGRLTPSIAVGATAGAAAGAAWSAVWPGAPAPAAALVGAVAFLAAAGRSPLTAVALVVELTGLPGLALLVPALIGAAGSAPVSWALSRRGARTDRSAED